MKKFFPLVIASALLFTGCGSESKPSTPGMAQFNQDFSVYMTAEVHKNVGNGGSVKATADCDPLNSGITTCRVTVTDGNETDHVTVENVQRTGDHTFDWGQKP